MVAASADEKAADGRCPMSQAIETLELRLTDAQIAAIRLRVEKRKTEIARRERVSSTSRQRNQRGRSRPH
jgi:hypothetical protein